MIPALIVPVLTGRHLLDQMLASVDEPVERLIVIDNGGIAAGIAGTVITPGRNLGVAVSWNLGLKCVPSAPWWLISNHDVRYRPGDLRRLVTYMDGGGSVATLGDSFSAFALSAATVARVGLFDENFVPAYCEDVDYRRRCSLAGINVADLGRIEHVSSATIHGTPELAHANDSTYPSNRTYYEAKWGRPSEQEHFTTPFNRGGSLAAWTLDWNRFAAHSQTWDRAIEEVRKANEIRSRA